MNCNVPNFATEQKFKDELLTLQIKHESILEVNYDFFRKKNRHLHQYEISNHEVVVPLKPASKNSGARNVIRYSRGDKIV